MPSPAHLMWGLTHALYGAGSLRAAAWVEPLKDQLYLHGAAPVLAALTALAPTTEEALNARTDAQTYFTRNVARMDYPRFVARQLPIGSGAVESACKCLVEARLKQAGMRWGVPGSQAIASLRAVQRSGRWAAFWQTHPDRQPAATASHPVPPAAATPAERPAAPVAPSVPARPPRMAAHAAAPRPRPTPAQRPLLLPRSA